MHLIKIIKRFSFSALIAVNTVYLLHSISIEQKFHIQQQIESLITTVDPNAHVGIEIISLKDQQTVYQKNSDHLFIPASSLKLFTCAAALYYLGPDYKFTTQLTTDGIIQNGILVGNLYLKGNGDPTLTTQNLQTLVNHLSALGITAIEGNICLDTSAFDELPFGPGWIWDEGAASYNSPINALTVNHNCIKLLLTPTIPGQKPHALLNPTTSFVRIYNNAITTDTPITEPLKITRAWLTHDNSITITGQIPHDAPAKDYECTMEEPALYAGTMLKELLQAASITVNGLVIQKPIPVDVLLLASHASEPLLKIIDPLLKNSDNLYAESLFKKLGQVRYNTTGSWQAGKKALSDFMSRILSISNDQYVIADGSGCSRYNLIAPHHLVTLLQWIAQDPQRYEQFLDLLPAPGGQGTLKDRLTDYTDLVSIRAKTGTMSGVSALAGFITTKSHEHLAFTIMINGVTKPVKEYKLNLEDPVCRILAAIN